MIRLLLFAAICGLVYYIYKRSQLPPPSESDQQDNPQLPMRPCAECGVHLPENECSSSKIGEDVLYFCCLEHQTAYLEKHSKLK